MGWLEVGQRAGSRLTVSTGWLIWLDAAARPKVFIRPSPAWSLETASGRPPSYTLGAAPAARNVRPGVSRPIRTMPMTRTDLARLPGGAGGRRRVVGADPAPPPPRPRRPGAAAPLSARRRRPSRRSPSAPRSTTSRSMPGCSTPRASSSTGLGRRRLRGVRGRQAAEGLGVLAGQHPGRAGSQRPLFASRRRSSPTSRTTSPATTAAST